MVRWLVSLLLGFAFVVSAERAFAQALTCPAAPPVISGELVPLADAKQNGRLNRGKPESTCASPTAVPGVINSGSLYTYDLHRFRNRNYGTACVTVVLTSSDDISAAAYTTFDPNDIRLNYLGDSGNRASAGKPKTFSFQVPSLSEIAIVVTEGVDGAGGTYQLTVAGCGELVVTQIVPYLGSTAGGTDVTIRGDGFLPGATAALGGLAVTDVVVVDNQTITARTPPHAPGQVNLKVTNTNGTSATRTPFYSYFDPGASTLTLTSSSNPGAFGEPIVITANVTPKTPRTATGTVTFREGATTLSTLNLNGNGNAILTLRSLTLGNHPITASYSGDALFFASTSNQVDQVIVPAATSTTLQSSSNPSVLTRAVTLTATVAPVPPSTGFPAGQVEFKEGATVLATVNLNARGLAALTLSNLAAGPHDIVASYLGSATYVASTSQPLTQVVNLTGTTLTLASSLNPSGFGSDVTFTAKVIRDGGGATPTGSVTFSDNDVALGAAVTLNAAGEATFTTSALALGNHTVKASYGGDGANQAATGSLSQAVDLATSTTTLTSSRNPSSVGEEITLTATVTSVAPGDRVGTITFKEGPTTLGTADLASGTATFKIFALSFGTHPIVAEFPGEASVAPSTSPVLNQTVGVQPPDAGPTVDAGNVVDSGTVDSGTVRDASAPVDSGFDAGAANDDREVEGGGCDCRSTSGSSSIAGGLVTLLAATLLLQRRRRR